MFTLETYQQWHSGKKKNLNNRVLLLYLFFETVPSLPRRKKGYSNGNNNGNIVMLPDLAVYLEK